MKILFTLLVSIHFYATAHADISFFGGYPVPIEGADGIEVRFQQAYIPSRWLPEDLRESDFTGSLQLPLDWDLAKDPCELVEIRINYDELINRLRDPSSPVESVHTSCHLVVIPEPVEPPSPAITQDPESFQ